MRRFAFVLLVASAGAAIGCAGGAPSKTEITDDYFYPRPPEPPRVQYLRSFNGSPDFESRNALLDYLAGEEPAPSYEITKPFSVATWKGRIYVTDSFGLQGLNVFDLEHRRFFVLGKKPGVGELRKPISVFADDRGYKFVSDLFRRLVVVYGPDDKFVRTYGDGRSFVPVACVAYGNEVYILDIMKDKVTPPEGAAAEFDEVRRDQILVLDRETGRPLRRIGYHGSGREGFSFASFLAVDRLGNLYVSDFLNHRVVKLDPQGNVLAEFGRHGDRPGDFSHMKGIAVDPRGLIYVVDAAFQLVQVFDNAGQPLFAMGGPRAPVAPMDLPAGIWIDTHNIEYFKEYYHPQFEPEYLIIVANQLSPRHKVAVYAYGKRKDFAYPPEDEITTLESPAKPLWRLPVFPPDMPQGPPE